MSEETNLTTQRAPTGLAAQAPSFMDADRDMGLELVREKIRPPFLKIVQKQSGDEIQDQFGKGAVVMVPDMIMIIEPKGAAVRIVPLFFYTEYLKITPYKLKGVEPMIADRTVNPASELARKCATRDLWFEDHPKYMGDPEYRYRNCEALTFVSMFDEPELPEIPFTLSFMKGSYSKGGMFCNQISMRKRPIFGCVFELDVDPVLGENSMGQWHRWRTQNPKELPFVTNEQQYMDYKAMHMSLKSNYGKGLIEAGFDDEELAGEFVAASTTTTGGGY